MLRFWMNLGEYVVFAAVMVVLSPLLLAGAIMATYQDIKENHGKAPEGQA